MKIFRAVSEAEKNDILLTNRFNPKRGGYEGKLFAASLNDASTFGREIYFYDSEPIHIIEVEIDDEFSNLFGYDMMDPGFDVQPTISVDRENLNTFNQKMTYNILEHVNTKYSL